VVFVPKPLSKPMSKPLDQNILLVALISRGLAHVVVEYWYTTMSKKWGEIPKTWILIGDLEPVG